MKKEEIKSVLSECTNLVELIGRAAQLKQNGEKETTVNRIVTQLRKELMSKGSSIKRIPREEVKPIDTTLNGHIQCAIQDLSKPEILYSGDAIVV